MKNERVPVPGTDSSDPSAAVFRTTGRRALRRRLAVAAVAPLCLSAVVAGCSTTTSAAHASGPTAEPVTPASTPTAATATAAASPSSPAATSSSRSTPRVGDALLPVALLPRPAGFGPWSRRSGDQGPALIGAARCALSAPADTGVAHERRDYVGPAGQAAAEVVASFADATAAEQAWSTLQGQLAGCSSGEPTTARLPGVGDGTSLLVAETREPSPQARDALAVGLVRTGRLVSLLVVQVPARTPPAVATLTPLLEAVAVHSAPFGR